MLYSEVLEKLYTTNTSNAKKIGLENCHRLDQIFDFPHQLFKSIHVAGTNGKGSVATMMAKALEITGYKVGLYTSPHISCFRERICINGQKIPEKDVEKLLNLLFKVIESHNIPATFFELTTYLAFLYYAQEKVDFVVLEAGLGGRWDATNVILPLLSVITSISLDHTELLGETLEEITSEKAGIIKPSIPVIIGPKVPYSIIERIAFASNSPLTPVVEIGDTYIIENQLIAAVAMKQLSAIIDLPSEAIQQALTVRPLCRLQRICSSPLIILDVAHNPDGLEKLFRALQVEYPDKKLLVLFGLCKNKDMSGCLTVLTDHADYFYPVEAPFGRGLNTHQLKTKLEDLNIDSQSIFIYPTIAESVKHASAHAKRENRILVVCGSFYIMDEAKTTLHALELM